MLEVAVPLWVVLHTDATRRMASVLDTVAIVLFQVRAGRNVRTVGDAARAQRRAGFTIAVACVVFALVAGHRPWVAAAVLVAGAGVHVAGELLRVAGS